MKTKTKQRYVVEFWIFNNLCSIVTQAESREEAIERVNEINILDFLKNKTIKNVARICSCELDDEG